MKKNFKTNLLAISLFFTFIFAAGQPAKAQTPGSGRFGLGLVLGSPTAITGKYWVSTTNAIDFGLGFFSPGWVLIYGDYLWGYPGGFGKSSRFVSELIPYVGVGGGLVSWRSGYYDRPWGWSNYNSSIGFYARVPLGVEWFPSRPPLGVFFELAPGIAIVPGAWIIIDVGLGIRFYF